MIHEFTLQSPTTLYIDINSCFASVEQQANPRLRGKPIVVAAYTTDRGCILAASREAKQLGIKTGMLIREARKLCPTLIPLAPDPEKYRYVNEKLTNLLLEYSPYVQVQSIDEMIVRMENTAILSHWKRIGVSIEDSMIAIAKDIKKRIREEIGVWITVSIGIAPNAFLAKTASNLKKPDGLELITKENIETVLSSLTLVDLCGIAKGNEMRLQAYGIMTPCDLFSSTPQKLVQAFGSCIGTHWWLWLHGWDAGSIYADKKVGKKSFSQSCALSRHVFPTDLFTTQMVYQLVAKMSARLRADRYEAKCFSVGCSYTDRTWWQKRITMKIPLYATEDIFALMQTLFRLSPKKPIHTVFVGASDVLPTLYTQLSFDEKEKKKEARTQAIDRIYNRFGRHAITSGITLQSKQTLLDRIAFGRSSL